MTSIKTALRVNKPSLFLYFKIQVIIAYSLFIFIISIVKAKVKVKIGFSCGTNMAIKCLAHFVQN